MSGFRFVQLPPGTVTRAGEMREAANARHQGDGDVLLAVAQLATVVGVACAQLVRSGLPDTAKALAQMLELVCHVIGASKQDLDPYVSAILDDSRDRA